MATVTQCGGVDGRSVEQSREGPQGMMHKTTHEES